MKNGKAREKTENPPGYVMKNRKQFEMFFVLIHSNPPFHLPRNSKQFLNRRPDQNNNRKYSQYRPKRRERATDTGDNETELMVCPSPKALSGNNQANRKGPPTRHKNQTHHHKHQAHRRRGTIASKGTG
jgi:hypothetical protein